MSNLTNTLKISNLIRNLQPTTINTDDIILAERISLLFFDFDPTQYLEYCDREIIENL